MCNLNAFPIKLKMHFMKNFYLNAIAAPTIKDQKIKFISLRNITILHSKIIFYIRNITLHNVSAYSKPKLLGDCFELNRIISLHEQEYFMEPNEYEVGKVYHKPDGTRWIFLGYYLEMPVWKVEGKYQTENNIEQLIKEFSE